MDVQNRNGDVRCEEKTPISKAAVKRPFDVAFLMLPDEKLKQKQSKALKPNDYEKEFEASYNNNDEDEEIDIDDSSGEAKLPPIPLKHHYTQKQQIFDDPNLIMSRNLDELRNKPSQEQRSAFTKVNFNKDSRLSPNLSASPDLNYQNSLSPSPPINRNYQNFPPNILSPNQIFKAQPFAAYQPAYLPENFHHPAIEHPFAAKAQEIIRPNFPKVRAIYRPQLPYSYQQIPSPEILKISPPELKFPPEIRSPATAILTSLLPPSLAALSLPAQNVCAKCNISFRMTSDLVYHMRSHHKNEANDVNKKRREEKLKCPVCAESFRERHHLTRHMTAHQDKDDDDKDVTAKSSKSASKS